MAQSPFGDNPLTSRAPMAQQSPFGDPVWSAEKTVGEDIRKMAPSALRTGVEMIPAGPGELSSIPVKLVRKLVEYMHPDQVAAFDQALQATGTEGEGGIPGLEAVRKYITNPIMGEAKPVQAETPVGKFVQVGLEGAPSALLNPGSFMSKLAALLGGTVGSEGAGQLAEYYKDKLPSWAPDVARFAGGGVGALTPQGFNQLSNPRPIPKFRQPQIDVLRTRNVPMTAGQVTGSKRLMMREDVARAFPEDQMERFGQAAMTEQGGFPRGTERATRPVMRTELKRMGAEFDRLEAQANVPFDQTLSDKLIDITLDYTENNPVVASVVENTMNALAKNAAGNSGFLTREAYKNMRTKLNKLIGNENADPGVTGALMDMKDALDDAIGRNLPREALSDWRKVRAQYRNYLPIERAKAAMGQGAAEGVINPKQLKMGVKAIEGRREIASGERPMTELAEAGESVLERPQSSGTAERQQAQRGGGVLPLMTGGGTVGALLSAGLPPALATAIGAGTGIASSVIPAARDAFIRSDIGQKILQRQGPRINTGTTTPMPDLRFPTGRPSIREVSNPLLQALQEFMREAGRQGGPR